MSAISNQHVCALNMLLIARHSRTPQRHPQLSRPKGKPCTLSKHPLAHPQLCKLTREPYSNASAGTPDITSAAATTHHTAEPTTRRPAEHTRTNAYSDLK